MKRLVIGLFSNSTDAGDAVKHLNKIGYADNLSVLVKDESSAQYIDADINKIKDMSNNNATVDGATTGALFGTLAGFLAGLTAFAIPGGIIVSGMLATTLIGAAGGATLGALTGALTSDYGITEEEVARINSRLEAGDVVLAVHVDDENAGEVQGVIEQHNAEVLRQYVDQNA